MNGIRKRTDSYKNWLTELSASYRSSQIKAAMRVNDEMLRFYWKLGRDMENLKEEVKWGSHFYKNLSDDLKEVLPGVKSFSPRNLLYMNQFYRLFPDAFSARHDVFQTDDAEITPQIGAQGKSSEIAPQVDAQFEMIFLIPWGHLKVILDRCMDNQKKALFYVERVLANSWSRAVLLNFLDTDLYAREGKAITNFALTLPEGESDLAQAITKDPYNFDFLTLTETYNEKELKDALMDNISRFLLELGNGFAFVGREVQLDIGETENYVDMLFYNIKLHCYVFVEVKVEEFNARDMGQLGTYMVAVNHQLKGEQDRPTLGLLICKSKDEIKARYALEASSQPMGISEYDVNHFMPENFKSTLPSIEEIEEELRDKTKIQS